ncbi:MAG: T9SS type A sorting domain-containing protein [Ignavibacteriaceae bacterium]|nr:T9SS type A sorting domain-containing protein [Ignavibacteriaceae bacterium]
MKLIKLFPLMLILFTSDALSQESWHFTTPRGVNDICFTDNQTIIAVGKGIWKTSDRGVSWKGVYPGFDIDENTLLNCVDFSATLIGFAGTSNGKILKTVNGGNSWTFINPNYSGAYTAISVLNSTTVVAVLRSVDNFGWEYSSVMRSADGGATWQRVLYERSIYMNDISFIDETNGWISARSGKAYKTSDGGSTWSLVNLPSAAADGNGTSISFRDMNNGIMTLDNSNNAITNIAKTTDGGNSWEIVSTGINGYANEIQYTGVSSAYLLNFGNSVSVLKTNDNGSSWSVACTTSMNRGMEFYNSSIGVIWSDNQFAFTQNGCQDFEMTTWRPDYAYSFNENIFYVTNTELFSPKQSIIKMTDGLTLKNQTFTTNLPWVREIYSFRFLTSSLGHAMATYEVTPGSFSFALVKTTDGGATWNSLLQSSQLVDFWFVNEAIGWYITSSGKVYKTLDSGSTWGEQNATGSVFFSDITFADENNGWMVAWYSNSIYRTTNGGLLWNKITIPALTNADINGLKFFDTMHGYLVGKSGSNGFIMKTNDGGVTWTSITPSGVSVGQLYGNQFAVKGNSEVYFYSGPLRRLYRTGDGGASWQYISIPALYNSTPNLGVSVVNSQKIYLSGGSSWSVLLVTKGFVTSVEREDDISGINSYKLHQNFPNPFNPSSTIRFTVPEQTGNSMVTLKIFDITGKEITTLLEGEYGPGTWSVTFDGFELSSGVYFYQLKAGTFEQTRKMMLIK